MEYLAEHFGVPINAMFFSYFQDGDDRYLTRTWLLSPEEVADVAAALLAVLDESPQDDPAVVQAAWARDIERRARCFMSGESTDESWDAVRQRITDQLTTR